MNIKTGFYGDWLGAAKCLVKLHPKKYVINFKNQNKVELLELIKDAHSKEYKILDSIIINYTLGENNVL